MKVYLFAIGNLHFHKKKDLKALDYINTQTGLLGITPCYPDGNLIVFDTLNNAKIAKNNLESNNIKTANHIMHGTLSEDKQDLLVLGPET